jgi:hypothetical protein
MALHEEASSELKRQVAGGSLSPKNEARAKAVLRHRRASRIGQWFKRYPSVRAFLALLGLQSVPPPPQK